MTQKTFHKKSNILSLNEIRVKKKTATAQLLKDTKKMARAISTGTCGICNIKKSCVNKAGVCSYCFENVLTPEERLIAKEEATHKIINIQVLDDRWGKQ